MSGADGSSVYGYPGGGGAGGSIWIQTTNLTGNGQIICNGGAGQVAGGE